MNFDLTDEQHMLADTLARFIAGQYGHAVRERIARSPGGLDRGLWQRFGELGAIGALFAEADGGFGGTGDDIAVVFEALGRGLVIEPFLGALVVGHALARAGSPSQRAWLARLMTGEAIAAFAHGEPDTRYARSHVNTRAVPHANGWRLDGAKAVVAAAEQADVVLVSARTSGALGDEHGISLFLVPREAAGLRRRGYTLIDGGRAADISFDGLCVPADALVGTAGTGFEIIEAALARGTLALCAQALGTMNAAFEMTLDYLRTRRQFGAPLGTFQALRHRVADLAIELEQARSSVINASSALDGARLARERALSAAKYTIGQAGQLVARESVQMHGGIGMTWELPLSHYAKRLVMIDHQLGDEDHHLARYAALSREHDAPAAGRPAAQ
ncbi:acyl-CoA dehydrogenase family protein [Trinickia caryophylli]|uniref:Acyl-CoA dehydrogenase n=1 Tax=Trinickia caryophylli TaxID=28094 RepID=A0A1X7DWP7_TRICW|nr:acyl-CoA dehydrogenase family protein [Trinickia caryophylli]PMS14229.1 pimeloyl-CoA dehydrogenase small subunit [Trinickia caryophylli]TRX17928.1 pimeloyl-CoA dehydrogenase small subunit [Trinickia caryophylli]WQE11297.1 acyl-CoA dehydrogenase family protein [Trinickia caryophylli]SMF22963.1 Acyl-CoA dehydrogenase [Trinickia caryophylli]GLU32447.1 acyl-CoA dehydrogenase [Trinickia caryophylli]